LRGGVEGSRSRAAWPREEEGGGKKEKKGRKEKKKRKRRKRKKRKEKAEIGRNRKMGKVIGKSLEKIRRIPREIRGRVFVGFPVFRASA
jgi:hypothetical protein